MKSILGIVKDKANVNEIIYSSPFKKISYKDFITLNLVFNIATKENIKKNKFYSHK